MNIEFAYEKDILNRNPNYKLVKTTDGAFTCWCLRCKNKHIMKSKSITASHSLLKIRSFLLSSSEHHTLLWLKTPERNLLTDMYEGFQILNKNTGKVETWNGSSWI